jgi:hypothetical protein
MAQVSRTDEPAPLPRRLAGRSVTKHPEYLRPEAMEDWWHVLKDERAVIH